MRLNLSCPDWETRLREGRPLVPDIHLDPEGDRAVGIFNKLRLADVPGTPTMADACGEWFRAIVRTLFGSLDPVTRARMIRELFLLVPKKNSKTTNGALLMLTALLMNQRPMAPMIMTAPVQDVAEKAYEAAVGAIELDDVLKKKLYTRDHKKEITHRETKAKLEIMTFDPVVLTGQKVLAVLIDELHVVAKMGKAASAIRQLRGGMLPFPEAFLAFITTQSEEQPTGVFLDELTKARDIRDGKRQGAMLPVLYEFPQSIQADKDKAWKNPKLWHMVTPNIGRSITIERLEEEMETAATTSEAELRAWASQHLDVEIGVALRSNGWTGAEHWEVNEIQTGLTLAELLARSEVVTVGIDGGGLDDLLGFSAVGRETGTGHWLGYFHAWAHECVLARRKEIVAQLRDFEKDGDLTILPDQSTDDLTDVGDLVEQCEESGLLDRVGVDPEGIGAIVDEVMSRKIDFERIVGISQGWKMVGAIKTVERKLASRTFKYGRTRLMRFCAGNAKVEPAGNAVRITKQVSGTAKIDPLMAGFNAATLMAMNPKPRRKTYQLFAIG